MVKMLRRFSAVVSLVVMASFGAARAQEAAALSDEQVKERLAFITDALKAGQPRARTWWYGWMAASAAATGVQAGLAAAHWKDTKVVDGVTVRDRGFAEDMLMGGVTTGLAFGYFVIDPLHAATAWGKLSRLPEGTPEERLAKLRRAEASLRECAGRERGGRSLGTHILNIAVNGAAGLTTCLAFHRPWYDGVLTFAEGEAVSLFYIFTQPTRAERDLKEYEARYKGKAGTLSAAGASDRHLVFGFWPGGVSLRWCF